PSLDPQVQSLQRLYVGYATETTFDAQGRVLIPPSLRKFAGLEKQVVLVGQGTKLELWDEQRWNDNQAVWLDAVAGNSGDEISDALKNFSF
ncbi:MAG: cell division/cell wall cluster transcriptional repressor MraZ, partial [Pseudomonadota bacterium]